MAQLTLKETVEKFHPVYFYRKHLDIAAKDILGLDLAPHHRIVLRSWGRQKPYCLWLASRGMGKSVLVAIYYILISILYPNNKLMVVAGNAFRGAKMLLLEIEKIVLNRLSSQLGVNYARAALEDPRRVITKDPSFWSIRWKNGSVIYGVPLGNDGSQIRGIRAFCIAQDESFLLPSNITQSVLEPMLNVLMDPTKSAEEQPVKAQSVKISTIDFSHRDFYKEYKQFHAMIASGKTGVVGDQQITSDDISVFEFNFEDSYIKHPDGSREVFWGMNLDRIYKKKENDSTDKDIWYAENKNIPMDLEGGFFSLDMLEKCSNYLLDENLDLYPEALDRCCGQCILGIDTAPSGDNTAFTVIKVGGIDHERNFDACPDSCPMKHFSKCKLYKKNSIIYAYEENKMSQKDRVKKVYEIMNRFNIVSIALDARGGGYELADLLGDRDYVTSVTNNSEVPLVYNPADTSRPHPEGALPILTTYSTTQDDNLIFNSYLRALFSNQNLLIPKPLRGRPDTQTLLESYGHIESLINQLSRIKAIPYGKSVKFIIETTDPETGRKKSGKKDLYSSLLYASAKLREKMLADVEEDIYDQSDIPEPVEFKM